MSYRFISDNAEFVDYCQKIANSSVIALDTEFLRVKTFYPKPGLFQIYDGREIVLADPCSITDWQLFVDILEDESIVKVLHACDEDIELFYHFLSVTPKNVFDTQVAAACCGFDYSMGYQRLLIAMLDVELDKGQSRSDWMRRPLSEKQMQYAADDVRYLIELYQRLSLMLEDNGLAYIVAEEYQAVLNNIHNDNFEQAYLKINQAWKLSPRQLTVLRNLANWRETAMRAKDLPRNAIMNNAALMVLAQGSDWNKYKMLAVEGMPPATVKASFDDIMAQMNIADDAVLMEPLKKPKKSDTLLHDLKKALASIAAKDGIAEQLLSKKALNEIVVKRLRSKQRDLPDQLVGWRRAYYQQALEKI